MSNQELVFWLVVFGLAVLSGVLIRYIWKQMQLLNSDFLSTSVPEAFADVTNVAIFLTSKQNSSSVMITVPYATAASGMTELFRLISGCDKVVHVHNSSPEFQKVMRHYTHISVCLIGDRPPGPKVVHGNISIFGNELKYVPLVNRVELGVLLSLQGVSNDVLRLSMPGLLPHAPNATSEVACFHINVMAVRDPIAGVTTSLRFTGRNSTGRAPAIARNLPLVIGVQAPL